MKQSDEFNLHSKKITAQYYRVRQTTLHRDIKRRWLLLLLLPGGCFWERPAMALFMEEHTAVRAVERLFD